MHDEAELVRSWLRGDRDAGNAILRLVASDVYGLCLRILRHAADAEDAAQEAFRRLIDSRESLRDVRDFRSWLATIASNVAINLRKRRGREVPAAMDDAADVPQNGAPADRIDPATLRQVLETLSDRERLALHYRFRMNLPLKEVASLMQVSEANVRVILHRAIARARGAAKNL